MIGTRGIGIQRLERLSKAFTKLIKRILFPFSFRCSQLLFRQLLSIFTWLQCELEHSPQQIILHVGTNDLRDHTPTVVAENIVDLARKIEAESNAEVILSELVSRSDNVSNDAVKAVNKRLMKYCNQNDWRMIKHQNIDRNCLNKSGLHLNEKGNNILFSNFVNALDNRSMH